MTTRTRNSLLIGITFVIIAALYAGLAPVFGYKIEWAGTTTLAALGVALGVLTYVLSSGSSD
jgi:hypothetical protein